MYSLNCNSVHNSTTVIAKIKGISWSLFYDIPCYVTMDYEKLCTSLLLTQCEEISSFLFQTTFLKLRGYSATNMITRALFLKQTLYSTFAVMRLYLSKENNALLTIGIK